MRATPTRLASSAISRPDSRRNRSATRRCAPGSVDRVDFTQLDPAELVMRSAGEQCLRLLVAGSGHDEEAGEHVLSFGIGSFAHHHFALLHAQVASALVHELLAMTGVAAVA